MSGLHLYRPGCLEFSFPCVPAFRNRGTVAFPSPRWYSKSTGRKADRPCSSITVLPPILLRSKAVGGPWDFRSGTVLALVG